MFYAPEFIARITKTTETLKEATKVSAENSKKVSDIIEENNNLKNRLAKCQCQKNKEIKD